MKHPYVIHNVFEKRGISRCIAICHTSLFTSSSVTRARAYELGQWGSSILSYLPLNNTCWVFFSHTDPRPTYYFVTNLETMEIPRIISSTVNCYPAQFSTLADTVMFVAREVSFALAARENSRRADFNHMWGLRTRQGEKSLSETPGLLFPRPPIN